MTQKSGLHRVVELFVVIAILVVLLGKLLYRDESSTLFLVTYGVLITTVMWTTFAVSFLVYKDPYEIAFTNGKKQGSKKVLDCLVSCMVAVKNEEENISRCIDSMLRQTYENKEVIVVNDASTDRTLDILKEYKKAGKITLIDLEKNVGKKRALGKAMAVAKGQVFAHTDSDSVWAPDAIERIVKIW